MRILIKIFVTYAVISMFSGILYAFGFISDIIPIKDVKIGWFIILWMGPMMITSSIAIPIYLYKMWIGKFDE